MVTVFQRQESKVKKNGHQCAIDNGFNVFHYYCPVCSWEKRTECKKICVIFVDKVVVWSSKAVILQKEREVLGKPIYMGLVGYGLVCFVVCPLAREQILLLWGSLADIYREWGEEGALLLSDDKPHGNLNDTEHFMARNGCNIVC